MRVRTSSTVTVTVTGTSPVTIATDPDPTTHHPVIVLPGQHPALGDRVTVEIRPSGLRPILVTSGSGS